MDKHKIDSTNDDKPFGQVQMISTQVPMLQLFQATMQMDASIADPEPTTDASSLTSTLERIVPQEFNTVAEKLQYAFELPQLEEFKEEFACWLCRSVLLRGFLFLTDQHICFWYYYYYH